MSKKKRLTQEKKETPQFTEESFHIKKEELLDFKSTANAVEVARLQLQLKEKEHALMEKDLEIQKYKVDNFYSKDVNLQRKKLQDKQNSYALVKKQIEDRIGYSLNDRVIDELTLEIKKL